jgi:hypothetical protein
MIKVEHTKSHPTDTATIDGVVGWVQVTDAELVLVVRDNDDYSDLSYPIVVNGKQVKPILISKNEKIKVGDWLLFWNGQSHSIHQLKEGFSPDNQYGSGLKIIALPEHFSQQQLQDIVDGKLKEGKLVVECEINENIPEPHNCEVIKLNPHITIYPVEEKMYTRDEVKQKINDFAQHIYQGYYVHKIDLETVLDTTDEWVKQNII